MRHEAKSVDGVPRITDQIEVKLIGLLFDREGVVVKAERLECFDGVK